MTQPHDPRKTFPVSWEELHRDAKALAWRLLEKGPWTGIVAISRGGLVPAAVVARELDVRLVDTVCVSSYDDRSQGRLTVGTYLNQGNSLSNCFSSSRYPNSHGRLAPFNRNSL